jgi:protein transport protein SEC24
VSITNFYGNFFIRGSDLLALPNVSCDTAFNVELAHEEVLAQGGIIAVQVCSIPFPPTPLCNASVHRCISTSQSALLYTSSNGERRICVHTLAKPVTTVLADLFRSVDAGAVTNMLAKVALDHALRMGLMPARRYLHTSLVDIVRGYRAAQQLLTSGAATGGSIGGRPGGLTGAPPPVGGGPAAAQAVVDPSTLLPESLQVSQ